MLRSELWLVARQATPSMSAGGAAEGAAEGTAGGPPLILGVEQRTINGVALGCVLGTCAIAIALCFRRARSGPRRHRKGAHGQKRRPRTGRTRDYEQARGDEDSDSGSDTHFGGKVLQEFVEAEQEMSVEEANLAAENEGPVDVDGDGEGIYKLHL